MLHGSCVSERPACSRSAGGLAASAAVPGAAEQVTSLPLSHCCVNLSAATFCIGADETSLELEEWTTFSPTCCVIQRRDCRQVCPAIGITITEMTLTHSFIQLSAGGAGL